MKIRERWNNSNKNVLLFHSRQTKEFYSALVVVLVRRLTSWQYFEATDINGSSDRQWGLCSRNCEQQRCVQKNLLHLDYFLSINIIAALKKFYRSTGIVAGMGSLLVVFSLLVYWDSGWYGVPYSRCRPRVCVFSPPTWWYTWHLINDKDPWYLIEEKRNKRKKEIKGKVIEHVVLVSTIFRSFNPMDVHPLIFRVPWVSLLGCSFQRNMNFFKNRIFAVVVLI